MKYILNGQERQTDEGKDMLEYDTIASMVGVDPARTPTITFSSKRGDGSIVRGQRVALDEGMVIHCMVTGSA